jgi:hypothetical protein
MNLIQNMKLIPFEKTEFYSPLDIQDVIEVLELNLEKSFTFGITFKKSLWKDYEGYAEDNEFIVRRILKAGINSFIPVVHGTITEENEGTLIKLRIRLHKLTQFLIVILSIFTIIIFFSTQIINSENPEFTRDLQILIDNPDSPEYLGELKEYLNDIKSKEIDWSGIILVIISYAIILILFNKESKIITSDLRRMLKVNN